MKKKLATALSYKTGDYAPRVVAQAKGKQAEYLLRIAQEWGITIVEDATLAQLLEESAPIGSYIPSWCWEAVARILAYIKRKEEGL